MSFCTYRANSPGSQQPEPMSRCRKSHTANRSPKLQETSVPRASTRSMLHLSQKCLRESEFEGRGEQATAFGCSLAAVSLQKGHKSSAETQSAETQSRLSHHQWHILLSSQPSADVFPPTSQWAVHPKEARKRARRGVPGSSASLTWD
jgi:hypothetical protein